MDSRESMNLLHSNLPGQGKNPGEHVPEQIPIGRKESVEVFLLKRTYQHSLRVV